MTFSALDSALLGPLVATDAMRRVFADEARLAAMVEAEAALARAQARLGLAPDGLAAAMEAAAAEGFDLAALGRETAVAGVPVIPFVKTLQARLPRDLETAFHRGATTQDIADTALVLQVRQGLDLLATDLAASLAGLGRLAEAHVGTPCVGRSYGQQAAPVSFGFKVAVWLAGLAEAASGLLGVRDRVLRASLGGPVGTLAAFGEGGPALADAFAAELGLAAAPIAWHTRRAAIAELGAALAILVGALAKMAADIAHLASTEVGEVAEPHVPGRGGSSAMPHKRNPVACTVILAAHAAAPGHVTILLNAMAAQHERPAGAWHAEWHALPSLFGLASGALAEGRRLAEGLTADPARMAHNLEATRGLLFADAVAARLGKAIGRGAAHEALERAADRVRATGLDLRQVVEADPAIAGRLGPVELDAAFDAMPAVRAAGGWVGRAVRDADSVRASIERSATTGS